jgi:spermidine synthase
MSLNEREWFAEEFEGRTAFAVRYSRKLFDRRSDFQRMEIFETEAMGRMLILNGCFMLTEKDAFIYHEMLVHPALSMLPGARDVLVIGGGDGGAVTEIVKYPEIRSVILCEIDPMVVESCREFFPRISAGLADPRVTVAYEDGASLIRKYEDRFDLVVVDSTDPVGPAKALFEIPFYESVKRSLLPEGVAVFQTESPLFMEKVFKAAVEDLGSVFGRDAVHPYCATIPCYPGGLWSFTLCGERLDPTGRGATDARGVLPEERRYYDREIHGAAFALPVFVKELLGDAGSKAEPNA